MLKLDKPIILLLSIPIILTLQHYLGSRELIKLFLQNIKIIPQSEMIESILWCLLIFFLYFIIPLIIIKFVFKESINNYGISLKGLKVYWYPYLIFYLLVLPFVILASFNESFRQIYPFYDYVKVNTLNFIIWELFYGLQFFSVEFFFRGYIVFGLKEKFNFYSIFIMIIPYCMIHFTKPMPEALGAIIAGLVLGYYAIKSNSLWGGVFLHWAVAITMDICAVFL